MGLFRRAVPFRPLADGTFQVNLPSEARQGLLSLAEELVTVQTTDRPELRRLFPTAYPDDPERDAGYQVFARDQLIDQRRAAVETMRRSIEADTLTEEELSAWMGALNDYRLVLGTMLDVSEDDDLLGDELDPDDPTIGALLIYHEVGHVVATMVDALTSSLPEPDDAAEPPS